MDQGLNLNHAEGVDYAWGALRPATLKAAGIRFVCRYLSHDPAKNLSRAEADELLLHGIGIVLVWESTGNRALAGKAAGIADAQAARDEAEALGVPRAIVGHSVPIYFAVDFDPLGSQLAAIDEYFIGVSDVLGYVGTGVYGSFAVVQREQGVHAHWGWQTYAWSAGRLSPAANLYQYSNGHEIAGVGVDFNRAEKPDIGAWTFTPPTVRPAEAHEVTPHGKVHFNGTVDVGTGRWGIARRLSIPRPRFGKGGDGRTIIEPLPADGEWWCAKVSVRRGR